MAMVCAKCQALIRNSDRVKALVHASFIREDEDSHRLYAYFEEWVEHINCKKPSYLYKFWVRLKRVFRNDR